MKKILAALLVLALGMPALADVAITATDAGNQRLQISFAGPLNAVRGVALTLNVSVGTITLPANFISSDFNTFIDYAFTTGAGYTIGSGHPFALETAPGVAAFPINAGTPFAVSVGYLDPAGTKLGLSTTGSGSVALIKIDGIPDNGSAIVTIAANATRGGAAVGDTLGNVTVQPQVMIAGPVVPVGYNLTTSVGTPSGTVTDPGIGTFGPYTGSKTIVAVPSTNYKFVNWTGDTTNIANVNAASTTITMSANAAIVANFALKTCFERLTATEQTEYNKYIAVRPTLDMSSWCWQFQCRGDANNATENVAKYRVYNADLGIILANWKAKVDTALPAADIDHASENVAKYRVYNADLGVLLTNWKAKDTALTACPGYVAP